MSDSKVGAVVRVSLGNFLEMYDFMVFGYYAAAIGRAFFPTQNEYASLMLSFMTFGTGYLMRPLGAVVLGAYIDHHGRRKGLLLTLLLMAVGTLSIGVMPGYARMDLGGIAYRIRDSGAEGGIVVSPLGLQEGAAKVAKKENIVSV